MEGNLQGEMVMPCGVTTCLSLLYQTTGILTPDTPCHLLVWGEGNQGRSILFQILHWIKVRVSEACPHIGSLQTRFTTMENTTNMDTFLRQWRKPTLETNNMFEPNSKQGICEAHTPNIYHIGRADTT